MMTTMFCQQVKTNINQKSDKSLEPTKILKRRVGYDEVNEEEDARSMKRNRMDIDTIPVAAMSSASGA
jgi:hypothetical protein